MISIIALANTIIKKALEQKVDLSPMMLQKLIYLIYATYLKRYNIPLFTEKFEAWQYGPVLPIIYDTFRAFGANSINRFVRDPKGDVFVVGKDLVSLNIVIDQVWEQYKGYTGIELSKLTHEDDSPWCKAVESGSIFLKDEDIIHERYAL